MPRIGGACNKAINYTQSHGLYLATTSVARPPLAVGNASSNFSCAPGEGISRQSHTHKCAASWGVSSICVKDPTTEAEWGHQNTVPPP